MEKFIIGLGIVLLLATNASAKITQAVCSKPGKLVNVTVLSDGGKWLGASVRLEDGSIEDIPPQKLKLTGVNYNFQYRGNAVEYRVSTWKAFKGGYMEGRISDTGWATCH